VLVSHEQYPRHNGELGEVAEDGGECHRLPGADGRAPEWWACGRFGWTITSICPPCQRPQRTCIWKPTPPPGTNPAPRLRVSAALLSTYSPPPHSQRRGALGRGAAEEKGGAGLEPAPDEVLVPHRVHRRHDRVARHRLCRLHLHPAATRRGSQWYGRELDGEPADISPPPPGGWVGWRIEWGR